jgi:hypothetical protein
MNVTLHYAPGRLFALANFTDAAAMSGSAQTDERAALRLPAKCGGSG